VNTVLYIDIFLYFLFMLIFLHFYRMFSLANKRLSNLLSEIMNPLQLFCGLSALA